MRLDLDELGLVDPHAGGPIARLGARTKIVAAFGFVLAVVALPVPAWPGLIAAGVILAVVVALARVRPWPLLVRWLGFVGTVGFLAALVARGHPARPSLGWLGVWLILLAKNSLAFVALMILAATTPTRRLLIGLAGLGVPRTLIATLHFMIRYLHVLADELGRMALARRSRSFGRWGGIGWGRLGGMIGMLLVRSLERGERVHGAMLARGWDGTIRSLDGPEPGPTPR